MEAHLETYHLTHQSLVRATSILQKLWYIYRHHAFQTPVLSVQRSGEAPNQVVTIVLGRERAVPLLRSHGRTRNLPHCSSEEDEQILLSLNLSLQALKIFKQLICWLLEGAARIDEIGYRPKDSPLRTRWVSADGQVVTESRYHFGLMVALHTNEVFAVQLTGAPYGWFEPMIPWRKFKDERLEAIDERWPYAEGLPTFLERNENPMRFHGAEQWESFTAESFCNIMVGHANEESFGLSTGKAREVLEMEESDFEEKERELLAYARDAMQKLVIMSDERYPEMLEIAEENHRRMNG